MFTEIAAAIARAMLTNLIAGARSGLLIPQITNHFCSDFAVSYGTFVTAVTDAVGVA